MTKKDYSDFNLRASRFAHDIRNQLNVLGSSVELLEAGDILERDEFGHIQKHYKRLLDLITYWEKDLEAPGIGNSQFEAPEEIISRTECIDIVLENIFDNLEKDGDTYFIDTASDKCKSIIEATEEFENYRDGLTSKKSTVDVYGIFDKIFTEMDEIERAKEGCPFIIRKIHFDEREMLALANPISIERVVTNLEKNSREAIQDMEKDCVGTIDVYGKKGYATIDDPLGMRGEYVEIKFVDNGPGIPQSVIRGFEKGEEVSTKEEGRGKGLTGMDMLVEDNHGKFNITKTDSEGTTITIYLPREGGF